MMRASADSRSGGDRRSCKAFTLIELMTVIAIILILAALVLNLAGSAQTKGAQSRATTEIQALSAAATNYQTDNGTYPRILKAANTKNTDGLDARVSFDPTVTTSPSYIDTSLILYQLLCGSFYIVNSGTTSTITYYNPANAAALTAAGIAKPTSYFPFKFSQLKYTGDTTVHYINPQLVTAIADPFGFSYGYSTAYQADVDGMNAVPQTATSVTHGYNPTFDLWSTGGYTPSAGGGKSYPSDIASAGTYSTVWIRNW